MTRRLARWLPLRRPLGAVLVVSGVTLRVAGFAAGARPSNLDYGVSRVGGDPGIAIHWVLCGDEVAQVVGLEGYWGGSQLPTAVPVFWQVRSDRTTAAGGQRVEIYEVGQTPPAGFYETVPLRRSLPDDLIAISGPPGDDRALDGMSFRPAELRRDAIYRGDYEFVTAAQFAADGAEGCTQGTTGLIGASLLLLGLGTALLAGRALPTVLSIALLAAVTGAFAVAAPWLNVPQVGEVRQERSAFMAGSASVPGDREILLDMSPTTHQPRPGGIFVGRILAPQAFAFVVSCEGPSIQIGESSEIENGGTGGRQLIGCDTSVPVRGSIADRSDRAVVVEIVIDPNGMSDWHVVVMSGEGQAGPFSEP